MVAFMLCACTDGITVESFDQGKLYERYTVNQDSVKHGSYSRFYKSGKISEKANYDNGLLDGKRILFFDNGEQEIVEIYKQDSLHGEYKSFYPTGQVEFVCTYEDNKIQGKSKKYYESGKLLEEVIFENNEENGPFKEYHSNGKLAWEGNYINGENEIGVILQYDELGGLLKKMQCDTFMGFSKCNTIWEAGTD